MALKDEIEHLAQKAKDLAAEHPDQVKQALEHAESLLDKQTGGTYTAQIKSAGDKAENFLSPHPPTESSS